MYQKQLDESLPYMQLNMTFTMDSYHNIFLLCNNAVVKSIFIKSSVICTEWKIWVRFQNAVKILQFQHVIIRC